MNKELTPLEAVEELKQNNKVGSHLFDDELLDIVETALKDYEEIEYKQNTINDFYEDTITMIEDLLNLTCTKIKDSLTEGVLYNKDRILEIMGFAIRYVLTFVKGQDFNEKENVDGYLHKKSKVIDILKLKKVPSDMFTCHHIGKWNYKEFNEYLHRLNEKYKSVSKEEYDLLKEFLL